MSHTPLTPEEIRNELLRDLVSSLQNSDGDLLDQLLAEQRQTNKLLAFLLITQGSKDPRVSWRVAWEYLNSRKDITPEERLGIPR